MVGGARQCSGTKMEVFMAGLQAACTRHHRTEEFSGILTNQYLSNPGIKREGWLGKTKQENVKEATRL